MKKHKLGSKKWLSITLVFVAITTTLNGISIYLLRFVTDYGLDKQLDKMFEVARWMLGIFLIMLLVQQATAWAKSKYLKESLILLKSTYITQLMKQDITQLQMDKQNKYRSNLTNDMDRYEMKFFYNVLILSNMTLQFAMAVVLISTISLTLVGGAFALLVLFLFITSRTSKPVEKSEAKKSESLEAYTNFVSETLQGFSIIKQHQLQSKRHEAFVWHAHQVQKDNYVVDVKSSKVDALNSFIQTFVIFSLAVGGIFFAKSNSASLGSIIMVAASFGNIIWPLQQLSPKYTEMRGIVKVLEDFEKNLSRPTLSRHVRVDKFETLTFDSCDLGYVDEEHAVLVDVNLTIQNKDKVLIVGASGAGKSTILKTIRQSIVPKQGQVTLNGNNIYDVVPIDYYSMFSTVDQIGFIFNGTVQENMTLYQPIPDDKVNEAMKAINLDHLDKNQRLKNNGSNVSGGQRARLMLARALCLNAQVVLCDEIFASLEATIAQNIEKDMLALDKTVINVSHIIFKDTLKYYDKIYIVEGNTLRLSMNLEEVWERMILSNQNKEEQAIEFVE